MVTDLINHWYKKDQETKYESYSTYSSPGTGSSEIKNRTTTLGNELIKKFQETSQDE